MINILIVFLISFSQMSFANSIGLPSEDPLVAKIRMLYKNANETVTIDAVKNGIKCNLYSAIKDDYRISDIHFEFNSLSNEMLKMNQYSFDNNKKEFLNTLTLFEENEYSKSLVGTTYRTTTSSSIFGTERFTLVFTFYFREDGKNIYIETLNNRHIKFNNAENGISTNNEYDYVSEYYVCPKTNVRIQF